MPSNGNRLVSWGHMQDTGAGVRVEWWKHQGPQDATVLVFRSRLPIASVTDDRGTTWFRAMAFPKGHCHASVWHCTGPLPPGTVVTVMLEDKGFVVMTIE